MNERTPLSRRVHGGPDAQGPALHDFSTNSNACGPCPDVVVALQYADASHYPDPHYTELRTVLARFHGVQPWQVVVGGSSSELIQRLTLWALRQGATQVTVPHFHYGDYVAAAEMWGVPWQRRDGTQLGRGSAQPWGLHWACEPSSPLGQAEAASAPLALGSWVLDCAYAPLRLTPPAREGRDWLHQHGHAVWQIWTPNKALGLTGVRAAYAIAPAATGADSVEQLARLAPSWVLGAHGVAFLQAWTQPTVQFWLRNSLLVLRQWKTQQQALCEQLGWTVIDGHLGPYFVARWPQMSAAQMAERLSCLRAQGIALRDARSFGLPGHVRLGVRPPASQRALQQAWVQVMERQTAPFSEGGVRV